MAEGHLERPLDRGNRGGRSRSSGYAKWPSMLKSLQEMGEKDKEENPTPAGIYSKESVGKVT